MNNKNNIKIDTSSKNKQSKVKNNIIKVVDVIIASLSGLVGGLFGGGGGIMIVPTLTEINKVDTKRAHATAILSILPLTIASSIVHFQGGNYDNTIFCYTVIGSIVGGLIGASLLKKLPTKLITFIFSIVMIIAGVQMLS